MACPMRVVLVAISLVLAMFAYWRFTVEDTTPEDEHGKDPGHDTQGADQDVAAADAKGTGAKSWMSKAGTAAATLFDMFTGRYLYLFITEGSAAQAARLKGA